MMAPLEGPIGIGALVEAVLLGCVFVQSCVYYKNSRRDTWLLKVLVSLILFFLLSHLGCVSAWLWASTLVNSGNASVPDYATILFGVSNLIGATILFLERCFFSHRVLRASNNHLLAFLLFIFCIFSFTAALGAACVFFINATANLTSQLSSSWTFPLVIISGLVCDLAISGATALYLRPQTDLGRVTWVLLLIAETSVVTSFVNVAVAVVYWLTKTNFAWVGLFVSVPGIFANTLLAALNARGCLYVDIEHQRAPKNAERLIDERAKKPPIVVTISVDKRVEKHSERSPV